MVASMSANGWTRGGAGLRAREHSGQPDEGRGKMT